MTELLHLLSQGPQNVLVPDEELKQASIQAVKASLDPIISQYSIFKELHVEGLDADQVWAQAQMVVDGALNKLSKRLYSTMAMNDDSEEESEEEEEVSGDELEPELDSEELDSEEIESEEEDSEQDESENEIPIVDEDDEELIEEKPKKSELDEGAFRLEDFQKQVLALEKDEGDDEEDVHVDYFAAQEDSEDEDPNAGDALKYEDFFGKPKNRKDRKEWMKQKAQQQSPSAAKESVQDDFADFEGLGNEFDEDQLNDAMESAKKDLFDEEEDNESDTAGRNLSKHELEQREIMKEIERLEAENVANKAWAVRGEVKAQDRPADSLMDTELDFERNSKPVPVITQDVTDSIEDVIRNRIKTGNFDDLARILPEDLPQFRKSRELEKLEEGKSQKSLAEIYEDEYAQKNDANYVSKESAELEEAHKEIENLYQALSYKLDALSSWTYTPKPVQLSTVSIVSNTPAMAMEDSQPAGMATESQLAPQEIYNPSAHKVEGEVVTKAGAPISRVEMSAEDKKRLRRKVKAKKARIAKEKEERHQSKATKEGSKANVIETLKKSGSKITVIGNRGEKRTMDGKLAKEAQRAPSAAVKL